MTQIAMKELAAMGGNGRRGENEVRVGLTRGVKWRKSDGVICSEGVKWCENWAAKGGKIV